MSNTDSSIPTGSAGMIEISDSRTDVSEDLPLGFDDRALLGDGPDSMVRAANWLAPRLLAAAIILIFGGGILAYVIWG